MCGNLTPSLWNLLEPRLEYMQSWALPRLPDMQGVAHRAVIASLAFSRDGEMLASGAEDGSIIVWDVDLRRSRFGLYGHSLQVTSLAFSPDGRTLASGGDDRLVRLWDLESQMELLTLTATRASFGRSVSPTTV